MKATYDANCNITKITDGTNSTTYVYDSLNQLTRENNQAAGKTWVWTYDAGGNITSRKEYAYSTGTLGSVQSTVNYTYGDAVWGDLLTGYNGKTITSDAIGNMTSDGTWSYAWQGRQLESTTSGSTTWNFAYNADGLRTDRASGSTAYEYYYSGSTLVQMNVGSNTLRFAYDGSSPMSVTYNGTYYYYVTNIQGDIIAILDSTGKAVVEYTYDAWGKPLTTTGSMAPTLGVHNPLRYRGYIYDNETGLYYVSSRYYDPEIGRFINADDVDLLGANGDFASLNLFAYCGNNPVHRKDTNGYFWETALDVLSLGASIAEVALNPADPWAWVGLAGDLVDLVPFVTGVGETTRAIKMTVSLADGATDVVDAARKSYNALSKLDGASDFIKATGSYEKFSRAAINMLVKVDSIAPQPQH